MTTPEAVSTWFGAFLVEGGTVRERHPSPLGVEELAERIARRRDGRLTPEEERLIAAHPTGGVRTADRRLASHGLTYDPRARGAVDPSEFAGEPAAFREAMLLEADRALKASWDPSIHLTEAVRALADIERAQNLLGERLGSWAARDAPELDPGDARRAAASVLDTTPEGGDLDRPEPALEESRRALARTYRALGETREQLEKALEGSGAAHTPNLTALLGADLAARMVAQAGSLERLRRLPASTIQVLGAERAFFEHLRGHAPPPRHGLLFLHPKIQSANRTARGRLSRALAGKVAIAARLDHAHAPLDERLLEQFEVRAAAIGQSPPRRGKRATSRLPLHRAAPDG